MTPFMTTFMTSLSLRERVSGFSLKSVFLVINPWLKSRSIAAFSDNSVFLLNFRVFHEKCQVLCNRTKNVIEQCHL